MQNQGKGVISLSMSEKVSTPLGTRKVSWPAKVRANGPFVAKKQRIAFEKGQGMPLRYADSAPDVICWLSDCTVLPCSALWACSH